MASLQPVSGPSRDVFAALRQWVDDTGTAALTIRTSGSTGEPKDVLLSRAAMLASAGSTLARLGGPGQWLLALPAHYVAGAQVLLRSVLSGLAPVFLDDHPGLTPAVRAMDDRVRRYASLVPTQLHRMLETDPEALAALDAVLLGGSAATQGLLERARAAGVRVVTSYGMTETCGGCVYDGVPLDGVGVRIATDGRIHLHGPVLFDGYAGRPDLTGQALVDGGLRTPDVGRLDDDGRLEVLGRADDVVVSGGVNVALPAVERRVREHPGVGDAAVLGVTDPEWGTRVVAVVVASGSAPVPGLAELRDFVSAAVPRTWAPREVELADALPMLESGKVDKVALREAR